MPNKKDSRKKEAIQLLYPLGYTYKELIPMLRTSSKYIVKCLKEANIQARPARRPRTQLSELEDIRKRIASGEYKYKIAESYGLCPSAISKRLSSIRNVS